MSAVAASLSAVAVLLGGPSSAHAASDGAYHIDFDQCFGDETYTFCAVGTTVGNFAATQSERMITTYHSQSRNTFSGFGCSGQSDSRENITYVLTPDGFGAYHATTKSTSTFACADGTVTCESMGVMTIANNTVRQSKQTVNCTPPEPS